MSVHITLHGKSQYDVPVGQREVAELSYAALEPVPGLIISVGVIWIRLDSNQVSLFIEDPQHARATADAFSKLADELRAAFPIEPVIADEPPTYEEQMIDAGRGHLVP